MNNYMSNQRKRISSLPQQQDVPGVDGSGNKVDCEQQLAVMPPPMFLELPLNSVHFSFQITS